MVSGALEATLFATFSSKCSFFREVFEALCLFFFFFWWVPIGLVGVLISM